MGLLDSTKPKTNPVYYQDASIALMVENCEPGRYFSPEGWMEPVPGTNMVLVQNYSKSGPAPDAFYAYSMFIQVYPDLVKPGQELIIPHEGVQPFLLETRAPYMVCSSDIKGSLAIIEVAEAAIRAHLAASCLIDGNKWEYNGEVEFIQALLH
jgi:hypothetical protein